MNILCFTGVTGLMVVLGLIALTLPVRTPVRRMTVLRGRTSACNTTAAATATELGSMPVLPVAACLFPNTRSQRSGFDINRKHRSCTSYLTLPTLSTRSLTPIGTRRRSVRHVTATQTTLSPSAAMAVAVALRLTALSSDTTGSRPVRRLDRSPLNLSEPRGRRFSGAPTTTHARTVAAALTGSTSPTGGSR